jgi:hypothetical protein
VTPESLLAELQNADGTLTVADPSADVRGPGPGASELRLLLASCIVVGHYDEGDGPRDGQQVAGGL